MIAPLQPNPGAGSCYVAGAMANQPEHGFPQFYAARDLLRLEGWDVHCPTDNATPELVEWAISLGWAFRETPEYRQMMRACIRQLIVCEHIFMLPNWTGSQGACNEYHIARTVGMGCWLYDPDPIKRVAIETDTVVVDRDVLDRAERVLALPIAATEG